ncbi:hypothetical protein BKA70DRAFT_571325 [Coprinopsis sp. MPI-PUGE-AT-0042]|nr:hypothetical protein BKA70DRAFT_571325 [Coprinopsis sp. MPI-PUGE-AT-0042]
MSSSNTLPSFVELMASLGLEQKPTAPDTITVSEPSPPASPKLESEQLDSRQRANSLRDMSRQKSPRYSPYSSAFPTGRRGSLSSVSSSSSGELSPAQESFGHRSRSPRNRRHRNQLCLNLYGDSSYDLQANMPISTYVRRKSPNASPTSPTFFRDSDPETNSIPQPLTIPVLPSALLPSSASSESFPLTPEDSEFPDYVSRASRDFKPHIWENSESGRVPYLTGVRISNASRSSLNEHHHRRSVTSTV